MDDIRRQQQRAREIVRTWPEYKRMSIIRHGRLDPLPSPQREPDTRNESVQRAPDPRSTR
jgi:hypothetical protein